MQELIMVASILWPPHFEKLAAKTQQGAKTGQGHWARQKGEDMGFQPSAQGSSPPWIRRLQGHFSR